MEQLKYKNCLGLFVEHPNGACEGRLAIWDGVIEFYSETRDGIEREFQESVNDYIEFCGKRDKKKPRMFSIDVDKDGAVVGGKQFDSNGQVIRGTRNDCESVTVVEVEILDEE